MMPRSTTQRSASELRKARSYQHPFGSAYRLLTAFLPSGMRIAASPHRGRVFITLRLTGHNVFVALSLPCFCICCALHLTGPTVGFKLLSRSLFIFLPLT